MLAGMAALEAHRAGGGFSAWKRAFARLGPRARRHALPLVEPGAVA
jgi:hypothetical protein